MYDHQAHKTQVLALADRAREAIYALNSAVIALLKPLPGAYALIHHLSHAAERVGDVKRILTRLYDGRALIRQLDLLIEARRHRDWPVNTPYPEPIPTLSARLHDAEQCFKTDFEALYLFGAILLDQWALSAAYIDALPRPEKYDFFRLSQRMESVVGFPALERVWSAHRHDILWLNAQVRFYRNRFVVHADRPWQRGHGRNLEGYDFQLLAPSPVGWLDDEELYREALSLLPLAPKWLQEAPADRWERTNPRALMEVLLDNIHLVSASDDRERIMKVAREIGPSTPTYQRVGERLLAFVEVATTVLREAAHAHPGRIVLGTPFRPQGDKPLGQGQT